MSPAGADIASIEHGGEQRCVPFERALPEPRRAMQVTTSSLGRHAVCNCLFLQTSRRRCRDLEGSGQSRSVAKPLTLSVYCVWASACLRHPAGRGGTPLRWTTARISHDLWHCAASRAGGWRSPTAPSPPQIDTHLQCHVLEPARFAWHTSRDP